MVFALFRKDEDKQAVEALYGEIVAASRMPVLYTAFGVPDTLEGRFESLTLHLALVQRALKAAGTVAGRPAQLLTDHFFSALDAAMREIGIGDMGVPRKMKKLAGAYFGRLAAYDAMLEPEGDAAAALARNLLGREGDTAAARPAAAYAGCVAAALSGRDLAGILALRTADFAAAATAAEAMR